MKHLRQLLVLLLVGGLCAGLSACETAQETYKNLTGEPDFELLPPDTMLKRRCASLCPGKTKACKNLCVADHNSCRHELRLQARKRFQQYVDLRMAQGELVDRTEDDFWNETTAQYCLDIPQCQERCEVGMRVCHADCGGTIMRGDKCYSNCKERKPLTPYDTYDEPDGWGIDSLL